MTRYLTIALIALTAAGLVVAGRLASVEPPLFRHESHAGINCILCHHDWPETQATERCKGCHLERAPLRARLEADFHGLCRGCHAVQDAPAVRCSGCHRPEPEPAFAVESENSGSHPAWHTP